jgi:hypothetical protein
VPDPAVRDRSRRDPPGRDSRAGLAESTLITIDCQNTYTRGLMALDGLEAALDEAAALLQRARSAGIRIIHVKHDAG